MMDLRCSFLVVRTGNPSASGNRAWAPKTARVPVPVRSGLNLPCSRTRRRSWWYWIMLRLSQLLDYMRGKGNEFSVVDGKPRQDGSNANSRHSADENNDPSLRLSPHSFLAGREGKRRPVVVSRYMQRRRRGSRNVNVHFNRGRKHRYSSKAPRRKPSALRNRSESSSGSSFWRGRRGGGQGGSGVCVVRGK